MTKTMIFLSATCLLIYVIGLYADSDKLESKGTPEIYKQNCSRCHGEQGKGDGPATKTIKSMKMADWTKKEEMAKFTDDDLYKIVSEGGAAAGKSKLMPAFKAKLTEKQIKDLVSFTRSLAKQ